MFLTHPCRGQKVFGTLYLKESTFFPPPHVSLCHCVRLAVLRFSSANGTWSVNRAMAIGKPKPNTNSQDTAPLSSLAFGSLETLQLQFDPAADCGAQCYRELSTKTEGA